LKWKKKSLSEKKLLKDVPSIEIDSVKAIIKYESIEKMIGFQEEEST
jgi:hypothetical protein